MFTHAPAVPLRAVQITFGIPSIISQLGHGRVFSSGKTSSKNIIRGPKWRPREDEVLVPQFDKSGNGGYAMASQVKDTATVAKACKSGVKSSQILPSGPADAKLKLARADSTQAPAQDGAISFGKAFGVPGIPMLSVLLVCILWTSWLIFLALKPNEAANWLMNTDAYDNGEFWLIDDANPNLVLTGAVGLVLVVICYVIVALRMLVWRKKLLNASFQADSSVAPERDTNSWTTSIAFHYRHIRELWVELTSFNGRNRKKWNAFLKLIDVAMEMAVLRQLLLSGSPVGLTYGFASFLALNAMSCVVNVVTDRFSALTEVFVDSIFDLSAAVLFPIVTLVYCYYNFDFDRKVYLTSLQMLPPGSFEHLARSFADPSEVALFRVCFDSLRISSTLDFVLRMSMNLTFCYRFNRVLVTLIWSRQRERSLQRHRSAGFRPLTQRAVPKGVTSVFIALSLLVLLSTKKAISDSVALCSSFPECVVYSRRWESSDGNCPRLILIDIDLAPKTYDEWIHPVDAFDKVKGLAASGMLTSVQVINRQLLKWPEELRLCRGLKSIYFMYTSTQEVPAWTKELQHLETLHIEGKYGSQNLIELPNDLFSNSPRLSTIHFGVHIDLKRLPPFTGVPHLQSVSLAWLTQLRELPVLDRVPELSRLLMSIMPRIERIPDLSRLRKLVEFVILRPSPLCCNGFLGSCDLEHVSCGKNPVMRTTTTTCLKDDSDPSLAVTPFLGSAATKKAFEDFSLGICQDSVLDQAGFSIFPTKETIDMCDGMLYRQCFLPTDVNYIELRRAEIRRGIGPKCDVVEEEWLGCGA